MNDEAEIWRQENERQYRVIDQVLTSHSIRGQQFERRALRLDVSLLIAAILLNGFVFSGDDLLLPLGVKAFALKISIGCLSILVTALSIVQLRVDWSGIARLHNHAASRLGALKLQFRTAWINGLTSSEASRLTADYTSVMESLPPIPESRLQSLYAVHREKRMCNELAAKYPGCPPLVIRYVVRMQAVSKLFREQSLFGRSFKDKSCAESDRE